MPFGVFFAVVLATTIPKLLKNYSNLVLWSGIIVRVLTSLLAIMKFVAEEQTELGDCFLADGKLFTY